MKPKITLTTLVNTFVDVESLEEKIGNQLMTVKALIYDPTRHDEFEKQFKTLKELSDTYYAVTKRHYNVEEVRAYQK